MVYKQIYKTHDDLSSAGKLTLMDNSLKCKKLGIQGNPGTRFTLVDNFNQSSDITLGLTGIFELNLINIPELYITKIIYQNQEKIPSFILIDILGEEGGKNL